MEPVITIVIYIHAALGGIGLLTGIGSMTVKKGSKTHKKLGNIFAYSMIISCVLILPIAWLPNHESIFLFLISLFTIYLILSGRQALTFKGRSKQKASILDLILSRTMLVFSLFMIGIGLYGLFTPVQDHILLMIFGGLGLFLTFRNFALYKNFKAQKKAWLLAHLTYMIGGLISAVTAFIVAGLKLWTLTAWVLPSVIGTLLIIYWRMKTEGKIGSKKVL